MKYLYADYDNLLKRFSREREQFKIQAKESFMRNILGFLDNFEQAVTAAASVLQQNKEGKGDTATHKTPPASSKGGTLKANQGMAQGILKLHQSLMQILKAEGLEVIPSVGLPFDLSIHEAVLTQETDEVPENTVLIEVQKGYFLHQQVLRPAKVIVSTVKAKPEATSEKKPSKKKSKSGSGSKSKSKSKTKSKSESN